MCHLGNKNGKKCKQNYGIGHVQLKVIKSTWFKIVPTINKFKKVMHVPMKNIFFPAINIINFNPSDSWFTRFKKRYNIKFTKIHGEKESSNFEAASNW